MIQTSTLLTNNTTLNQLIIELGSECENIITLIDQLQSPHLSSKQKAEVFAELLVATTHLNSHCGEDFQTLIAEEMETLPDDDED